MRVSFVGVWVYVLVPVSRTFLSFFMSWAAVFASGAFLGLRKGGSGKASFASAAVFCFPCITLLSREALIIWVRLFSASREPLNPSGLVGLYFAFLLSVLGSFLLPIRPLRVCAPLLLPASPLSDSLFPSSRPFFRFWGMLLNFGAEIRS